MEIGTKAGTTGVLATSLFAVSAPKANDGGLAIFNVLPTTETLAGAVFVGCPPDLGVPKENPELESDCNVKLVVGDLVVAEGALKVNPGVPLGAVPISLNPLAASVDKLVLCGEDLLLGDGLTTVEELVGVLKMSVVVAEVLEEDETLAAKNARNELSPSLTLQVEEELEASEYAGKFELCFVLLGREKVNEAETDDEESWEVNFMVGAVMRVDEADAKGASADVTTLPLTGSFTVALIATSLEEVVAELDEATAILDVGAIVLENVKPEVEPAISELVLKLPTLELAFAAARPTGAAEVVLSGKVNVGVASVATDDTTPTVEDGNADDVVTEKAPGGGALDASISSSADMEKITYIMTTSLTEIN